MLRVGLTGGLASGKSTVAAYLRGLGAVVFDADGIVRDLYAPGGPGSTAALELFGAAVLDRDGCVDRGRIAEIVFADPEKRHALEARIHPIVRTEVERQFGQAQRSGAAVAVAEASQILEAGSESNFDRLLLVVAPESERIRRWESKGGAPEDARRRIAAQISPAAAFDRATDVIANDGTLADLKKKVEETYRRWLSEVGARIDPLNH